jgi:GT2 family glycosyltransferase
MQKNDLSIIIVSFNSEKILESCLLAIENSKGFSSSWEIIVVDNASSDQTTLMVNKKFPKIKMIYLKENIGFAAANNKGVAQSQGDFVLFLNPDVVVEKEAIKTVLDYLMFHKEVGIATAKLVLPDGKLDDSCHRGFPTPWNALCYFSGLTKIFPKIKIFSGYTMGYLNRNKIHEVDAANGAFMMVRRETGKQINWWDEDYFWYGDDLDFCYRAKENGWQVLFLPQVAALHYKGLSSGIKKHSNHLSTADLPIRIRATNARFDVMKIFYQKHYQRKYPWIMKQLVLLGVELKRRIALRSL